MKIPPEKILFIQAMLIMRSDNPKKHPEYKRAKKFLKERYKKQGVEVSI